MLQPCTSECTYSQDRVRLTIEGPRTSCRVGQPKMKYWKLQELHKNEVKKMLEILLKCVSGAAQTLRFLGICSYGMQVWGGGGGGDKFNSVGLDHSGSQAFIYGYVYWLLAL